MIGQTYHILEINIHRKINILIQSRYEFYIDYFKKEYPDIFYNNENKQPVDITFFIDSNFPEMHDGDIYIKKIFKKLYPYECLIRDLDKDRTQIYFKTPKAARFMCPSMAAVFLHAEILEPIIYLKVLRKDMLMVHASGIFDSNGGYIFAASSKVGKTTTAFHLLLKGFGFLGDDLVFLSKEGNLFSYPKRVHFFSYLKNKNPFLHISAKIMIESKIRHVLRTFLRCFTGRKFYLSTRLDIKDIMPDVNIGKSVMVRRLFLLLPSNGTHAKNSSSLEDYRYIIDTCDTRKSLIENIMKYKNGLNEYVLKKENSIIESISKSFNIEKIVIQDVVKDNSKIVRLILNNK